MVMRKDGGMTLNALVHEMPMTINFTHGWIQRHAIVLSYSIGLLYYMSSYGNDSYYNVVGYNNYVTLLTADNSFLFSKEQRK